MKMFKIVLAATLLGLITVSSCKKAIDIEPTHVIDGDNAFKNLSDYEGALTGAYARLLSVNYYGSFNSSNAFACLSDMMTDNLAETNESLANYTNFARWTYTADDNNIGATWLSAYRVIQQCNLTLRNIDKLAAANQGEVNRIKAQAIALRAYVHFDILRYWGEGSLRNSTLKGIPYVNNYDIEQKPSRPTVKETYDAITNDLLEAKSLMQNMDQDIESPDGTGSSDRAYIDEIVANAMLARIYNYAGENDSAIKYSTLVIDARPLAGIDEFPSIWDDASTADVIWSVKFTPLNTGVGDNVYYATGDRSSFRPTTNLINLYDQANDVRFSSYYQVISGRRVLSKYLAKQAQLAHPDGIVDFKAIRTGEMYLIRAEAYANKTMEGAALDDLNALREARIANFIPGTETGLILRTAIFNERRKELVCENQRWFDLKRTTRSINRTTNCTNGFCTLAPDAREWVWPIPQNEILANPDIAQSTGY